MSVRIRLRRMGARKQPYYRVVVADSRSPRDGRFLDTIGTYNPRTEPAEIRIDREKALAWLENGAEPTDSARSLLSKLGIWQRFRTGEWPAGMAEVGGAEESPTARGEEAVVEEAPPEEE
jgi:small subunit ribosomal protein S16